MRYFFLLGFLGLTLVSMAGASWAFDHPAEGRGGFQNQLLEIKRTQLGSALGVDQRTVNQLIKIDQKYNPLKDQSRREAKAAFEQLQQVMRNPNPSQEEVRAVLSTMLQKEQEITSLKQRQQQEEMAVLTPVQQARYLLYLMGLRQQIAREARSLRESPKSMQPITPGPEPREVVRPTE
jgi:Spy/CpxP family protein refolding chaperone